MGSKFQEATSKLLDVMRRSWLKKHGVPLPAPTMTAQQRAEIQECFEMLDRDGSGALDVKEILHAFGALGFTISKGAMSELMSEADPDGSGELEFDEFLSLMGRALYQPDERGMALVAKTGSGDLSFADVVRAFRRKKLIESLIRGGDARLKVVEFHERVQELIRTETEALRHRENTHAIFERMESVRSAERVERGKLNRVMVSPSQRSQKVKAKMRDAIGRSLGVLENLYRRHQSHTDGPDGAAAKLRAEMDEDGDGGGGRDDNSGWSRASSPLPIHSLTFLTEVNSVASGWPPRAVGPQAFRRPRPVSDIARRHPSRSLSMSVLSRAKSRKISAAVLGYFKQLEEQAKKMEQRYDGAARLNASFVPPPPDRSEYSQALHHSSRHATSRFIQSASISPSAGVANGSGAGASLSGPANGAGEREQRMSSYTAPTLAAPSLTSASEQRVASDSAMISTITPVSEDGSGRGSGSGNGSGNGSGSGAHSSPEGTGHLRGQPQPPPPQLHHQHQRQRLLSDGSEIRQYPLQSCHDGPLDGVGPTTAAWADFMAAAAAVTAGASLSGGAPATTAAAAVPLNTSTMASRAWRQTPSFGPGGTAPAPVGWGAGGMAAAARRGGGGGGATAAGSAPSPSPHCPRSIGHGASRTASAHTRNRARPSSGCVLALPPVPRGAVAMTPDDPCSPPPRSRSASPSGQQAPSSSTTAFSVTTCTSQSGAAASSGVTGGHGPSRDTQLTRAAFVTPGLASGGSAGSGLGLPVPGPMTRAWLAHTRSMPPGGGGGGGGAMQRSVQHAACRGARRQASVSANGLMLQGGLMAGGGGAGVCSGAGAGRSPGHGQRTFRAAIRNPGGVGSTAAAGSFAVPLPPSGSPGGGGVTSEGQLRDLSRNARLGPKPLTQADFDVISNGSTAGLSCRETGASGSDDMLLPGAVTATALRAACRKYWRSDSDGGGSRGPTIDGCPSSGDGVRVRRVPAISGFYTAVAAAASYAASSGTAAAGSTVASEAVAVATAEAATAAAEVAVEGGKEDIAVGSQDATSSASAEALAGGPPPPLPPPSPPQQQLMTAAAPDPAVVSEAAEAEAANSRVSVGPKQSVMPWHTPPSAKLYPRESSQPSAPSVSPPPTPRSLSIIKPATIFEAAATATPSSPSLSLLRNPSVDGDSPHGQMASSAPTAPGAAVPTVPAAAVATAGTSSDNTYSVPGGVTVATSSPSAPSQPPTASTVPASSPMRSRGACAGGAGAGVSLGVVGSIPTSMYAPRGAYMSLQLTSQRSARSAGSAGSAGNPQARPPAALKPSASTDSPPAVKTPPLQDRVVATFFGQALPRARNGAVLLPAMGPPPQSYPPELLQQSVTAAAPGGAAPGGKLLTRPWPGGSPPPAVAGHHGPLAATAAAASAWLTFPGGPPSWPAAAAALPPSYVSAATASPIGSVPGGVPLESRRL